MQMEHYVYLASILASPVIQLITHVLPAILLFQILVYSMEAASLPAPPLITLLTLRVSSVRSIVQHVTLLGALLAYLMLTSITLHVF